MSCKAAIYTANQATQPLFAGNTIALGSIIRRFGCGVNLNGNGITVKEKGYYDVKASVTVAPTAVGTVTVTLFRNGVAVPGAAASATVSAANASVALPIAALIRESCCGDDSTLTLVLSGTNSNVTNVAFVVERV